MANRILYSQANLEDIIQQIKQLSAKLEAVEVGLNQVDCSPRSGGNITVSGSSGLSGITASGNVSSGSAQQVIREYVRVIRLYNQYCERLANAVKQVDALFLEKEAWIKGNTESANHAMKNAPSFADAVKAAKADLDSFKENLAIIMKGFLGSISDFFSFDGDPVNTYNGNYLDQIALLKTYGPSELSFTVYYNSGLQETGSLGRGWTHSFIERLFFLEDSLVLMHANMACEVFAEEENGCYRSKVTYDRIMPIEEGYCRSTPSGEKHYYDQQGTLVRMETPRDGIITLNYKDELLESITDQYGTVFRIQYGDQGRIAAISDHVGRTIDFSYDNQFLTGIKKADGVVRKYGYDDKGRLNVVYGPNNIKRMINEYDEENRVVRQEFCDGTSLSFVYRAGETLFTQRNGETICYRYDEQGRHVGTIYPDGAEETYSYDERCQRIGMTDACGNRFARKYSEQGDLLFVENPIHDRETYTYDENHHLLKTLHADGASVIYEYDASGNKVSMTDPEGVRVYYLYSGKQMTGIRAADESETRFEYNAKGLVSKTVGPNGETEQFEYDGTGKLIRWTDPLGYETRYEYDGCDRLIREINANGLNKRYTYDYYGHIQTLQDFDGLTETWEYNPMGFCTRHIDKAGRVTQNEYDSMSNVCRRLLPNGGVEQYEYDVRNRLKRQISPEGETIVFHYDACGRLIEKKILPKKDDAALPYTYAYDYDACGRLCGMTSPNQMKKTAVYGKNNKIREIRVSDGTSHRFIYDKAGRLIQAVNQAGFVTEYDYYPTGMLREIVYPDRGSSQYDYYPGGLLKTALLPDNVRVTYEYDACGHMICRHDSRGLDEMRQYDCLGQIIGISDNAGHNVMMEYDALGRMTHRTDAAGNTTHFTYTSDGMLKQVTYPDHSAVRYRYNEMNQMIAMLEGEYSDQEAEAVFDNAAKYQNSQNEKIPLTTWMRDLEGRVIQRVDALGLAEKFTYNSLGQLISHADADQYMTTYSYDVESNVRKIAYSDGRAAEFAYDSYNKPVSMKDWTGETSIRYNASGLPELVTDANANQVAYRWNNGRLSNLIYPNGFELRYQYNSFGGRSRINGIGGPTPIDIFYETEEHGTKLSRRMSNGLADYEEYTPSGQLIRQTHIDGEGNKEVTEYTYDEIGNVIREEQTIYQRNKEERRQRNYAYDSMNRLKQVVMLPEGIIYAYEYDQFGNRVSESVNNSTTHYTYNALHQLVKATCGESIVTYQYDRRGNRILESWSDGKKIERRFNAQNRLESVKNSEAGCCTYLNNGIGMIVKQTDEPSAGEKREKHFVLDLNSPVNNLLMETENHAATSYVWGKKAIASVRETGIDWFGCDRQGSIRSLFDSNGRCTGRIDYTPYGEPLSPAADSALGYTGLYRHHASGTWYAQTRDYDPLSGQFISRDKDAYLKHMFPGGVDLYKYCLNNPILWVDLEGTDCYIFYLPEWKNEAVNDRRQLARQYGLDEDQVHLVPIKNDADLSNAWNAMGTENGQQVDIDAVVINTHANNSVLGYGDNSNNQFSAYDVRNLEDKDVGTLILLGCNAGHRDHDNIAEEFCKKTNGGDVIASDGTVYSGLTFFNLTDRSYKSKNDKHFRDQRDSGSKRDNYGWMAYRYEGSTIYITRLDDKKMTVSDMIKTARKMQENRRKAAGC